MAGLIGAYSGGELTNIEGGGGFALFAVDGSIGTLQTLTPASNATGDEVNEITVTTTVGTTLTDLTVIITKDGETLSNLKNLRLNEDYIVTYVRKQPSGTTLYIGRTAFLWTTSSKVYIVGDVRPQQKPSNVAGATVLKDADVSYRAPLPRVSGIYATWINDSGASANYSPTPTLSAMASGATISSTTWHTIAANGTVSRNVSASTTPTLSLNAGLNWVQCETTDSNGNSNRLAVPVFVGDVTDCRVSDRDFNIARATPDGGTSNATLTAYGELSDTIIGSPFMVLYETTYSDSDVTFFGYLSRITQTTQATNNRQASASIELYGVSGAMAQLGIPQFQFNEVASPASWTGAWELAQVSCGDVLWSMISEHSTVANCASIALPSGYGDYRFGVIQSPQGTLWDACNTLMNRSQFAPAESPDGGIVYEQDASLILDSSDRDALTELWQIDTDHHSGIRPNTSYSPQVRQAYAGAATYDTTTKRPYVFEAQAPRGYYAQDFRLAFDSNILKDDISTDDASVDAGLLAYNYYAQTMEVDTLDIDLNGGFLQSVPRPGAWVTVNVDNAVFVNGVTWSSSDRWQILAVSVASGDEGRLSCTATIRRETGGVASYGLFSQLIEIVDDYQNPFLDLPPGLPNPYVDDYPSTPDPNTPPVYDDPSLPPTEREGRQASPDGIYRVRVPLRGGVVTVPNLSMTDGNVYEISTSGWGEINGEDGKITLYDFTIDQQNWYLVNNEGVYTSGVGFESTIGNMGRSGSCHIRFDFSASVTLLAVEFVIDTTSAWSGSAVEIEPLRVFTNNGTLQSYSTASYLKTAGTHTLNWSGSEASVDNVQLDFNLLRHPSIGGKSIYKSVTLTIQTDVKTYGDAISYWDTTNPSSQNEVGNTQGLTWGRSGNRTRINNGTAVSPTVTHSYIGNFTADGSDDTQALTLEYVDPFGVYSDNQDVYFPCTIREITP